MKMDAYLASFCKTLKADILRSKYKEVITKGEKIIQREACNFKQLSRNSFIHFLYLESYCCHKIILKALMEQSIRLDTRALETSIRILFRNLRAIYLLIRQYLQNRQVIVKFTRSHEKQTRTSHLQQNTTEVSETAFTNFLEISTWLIKDQILLLNLNSDEHSKSEIFEIAIKFLHSVADTIKRKKVRLRVNQLEIKCQFVVYLFRIKEYSKGSKLSKETLTEIYEFLFFLTHKSQKATPPHQAKYKKAIKKCYKLLLIVLMYQAFYHVVLDSIHPLEALLSIVKQIQPISGPKQMIKYYQSYNQIFTQLLSATRAHEEFYDHFKNGQIITIREILTFAEIRDKLKMVSTQTINKNNSNFDFHFQNPIFNQQNLRTYRNCWKSKTHSLQKQTEQSDFEKLHIKEAKSKFFQKSDQKFENSFLLKSSQFVKKQQQKNLTKQSCVKKRINFLKWNQQQSGQMNKFVAKQIVFLSEVTFQNTIRKGKNELVRKKIGLRDTFASSGLSADEIQIETLIKPKINRSDLMFLTGRSNNSPIDSGDNQHLQLIFNNQKKERLQNQWSMPNQDRSINVKNERIGSSAGKKGLKKRQFQWIHQIINSSQNKSKPIVDKFIDVLVRNKNSLSIWSLANKLEGHLKRKNSRKAKDKTQIKLVNDNLLGNLPWQKKQSNKFRSTSPEWKEWKTKVKPDGAERSEGKLHLKKMRSENLRLNQKDSYCIKMEEKTNRAQEISRESYKDPTGSQDFRQVITNSISQQKELKMIDVNEGYEQRLRMCYKKSRESIEDVTKKVLRKSENYRRTKDRNIKKSQAFFSFGGQVSS